MNNLLSLGVTDSHPNNTNNRLDRGRFGKRMMSVELNSILLILERNLACIAKVVKKYTNKYVQVHRIFISSF